MKAWLIDELRGIDALRIADVPDSQPGKSEAVLTLNFAALNPADRYLAEAQYPAKPALPHILGRDGIGTVTAVGIRVKNVRVGEKRVILRSEVGVNRAGTFAEKVAVPVESLVPKPEGWSDEQAAAAPLVYLTAWQALTQWGELPENGTVLITGASGGVGVAATQLAKSIGLRVIALSRSEQKQQELKHLGADYTYNPEDTEWSRQARAALGNARIDLVIDNIGGTLFPKTIELMGMHGRVSVVGRLAGPVPEFNTATLFFRRLRVGGVAVGTYTAAESQQAWKSLLEVLEKTNAKPVVDQVFSFNRLPEAFERLERGPMGKVLISVPS